MRCGCALGQRVHRVRVGTPRGGGARQRRNIFPRGPNLDGALSVGKISIAVGPACLRIGCCSVRVVLRQTLGWSFALLFATVSVCGQWLHFVAGCGHAHGSASSTAHAHQCPYHASDSADASPGRGAARPSGPRLPGPGLWSPALSLAHDGDCAICKYFSQANWDSGQQRQLTLPAVAAASQVAQPFPPAFYGHLPYQPRAPPAS
jgi:hypothetical protein